MAEAEERRISADAVNDAIRALAGTKLRTKTESMLRTFLCFSAIRHHDAAQEIDISAIRDLVEKRFTLLPTPEGARDAKYDGTISLRGSTEGKPVWLRNDSYRGSFLDYAGPSHPGRILFVDESWRKPLVDTAVEVVVDTLGGPRYAWPPSDALAAVTLAQEDLDPSLEWEDLEALAQDRFGLDADEWKRITSDRALSITPFSGDPWSPAKLASELTPAGLEKVQDAERSLEELPRHLRSAVERVQLAMEEHGAKALVALAGVPGTSKSHTARHAARLYASKGCLREIQFSPGYTYEEFMEGPRYGESMEVEVVKGVFLDLNKQALEHQDLQYVLLIEELTRADIPRVFGELLTYIEYRGENDEFNTIYDREEQTRIAPNIAILATYNPTDSSAVNVDAALLRRMRVLDFPPDLALLEEILSDNGLDDAVIEQLASMFEACEEVVGADRFAESMPFGHAVFAGIEDERDLHPLWHEELKRILVRPHTPRHELFDTIIENFPWHSSPDKSLGAT